MPAKSQKKAKAPYHHGDLERALVDMAVQVIGEDGMDGLTLRGVGSRLGVSRTALYRHFEDKAALLAQVAQEGFVRLRTALESAASRAKSKGGDPMEEICGAYVAFAVQHRSHYRTMFGRTLEQWGCHPGLGTEAEAAFQVLIATIAGEQHSGRVTPGDPLRIAQVVWPMVHGIASLGLDGQLSHRKIDDNELENLARFAWRSLRDGITPARTTQTG